MITSVNNVPGKNLFTFVEATFNAVATDDKQCHMRAVFILSKEIILFPFSIIENKAQRSKQFSPSRLWLP